MISAFEVKLSVIEPYYYYNEMVDFEINVNNQNRDHPNQISTAGSIRIKGISCKGKNEKSYLKNYNKRYNVPSTRSIGLPKTLPNAKWIEYQKSFQY